MLWFKKHKENKINMEFEDIKDEVRMNRSLGAMHIYLPIKSEVIELVRNWCAAEGYKMEVDHITDDMVYYKISGWD